MNDSKLIHRRTKMDSVNPVEDSCVESARHGDDDALSSLCIADNVDLGIGSSNSDDTSTKTVLADIAAADVFSDGTVTHCANDSRTIEEEYVTERPNYVMESSDIDFQQDDESPWRSPAVPVSDSAAASKSSNQLEQSEEQNSQDSITDCEVEMILADIHISAIPVSAPQVADTSNSSSQHILSPPSDPQQYPSEEEKGDHQQHDELQTHEDQDFGLDLSGVIFEDPEDDFGVDYGMIFADDPDRPRSPMNADDLEPTTAETTTDEESVAHQRELLDSADTVRFVDFEKFRTLSSLPRFSDHPRNSSNSGIGTSNSGVTVSIQDIDREHAFVVFVSHRWVPHPNHAGEIKPDDEGRTKFHLCVKGIEHLWRSQAPRMRRCYLWIDCACIPPMLSDAHSISGRHLQKLSLIMRYCDCVFTPLLDMRPDRSKHASHPKLELANLRMEASARAKAWNNGPYAYLNRAWVRLEILYASYVPVNMHFVSAFLSNNTTADISKKHQSIRRSPHEWERKTRLSRLSSKLLAHHRLGHRPHFVYGTQESKRDRPPSVLQVLKKHTILEKYDPRQGYVSIPPDMDVIERLTLDLMSTHGDVSNSSNRSSPDGSSNSIQDSGCTYRGDRNELGEMHGYGTLTLHNNNSNTNNGLEDCYAGEFVRNKRCGHGSMTYADGSLYEGFFSDDVYHGRGTKHYHDGSVYEGEWVLGVRAGRGKYVLPNGDHYSGEFRDDCISGKGKLHFEKGTSVYQGEFEDGDFHGEGVLHYANGDVYKGRFERGTRVGEGAMKLVNGNVYKGQWENNERHGKGVLKTARGDIYEGDFRHNGINGKGRYKFSTGDVYIGDLKNGQMHGQGVYMYANGSVYEGEFRMGMSNGQGRYNFSSGDFYEGAWVDDRRHGQGLLRYKNGGEYFGEFVDNAKQGRGRFVYPNGEVYQGMFSGGKRVGVGVYRFGNGDVYDGQWRADVIEGEGIMKYANGDVYEGLFEGGTAQGQGTYRYRNGNVYRGELVQGIPHGHGTMLYANRDVYEGEFRVGKKYGPDGVYQYANGNVYRGAWKNDKKKRISIGIIKRALFGANES